MFSTRTKKITAYGRRGQRYVPVSETLLGSRLAEAKSSDRASDVSATENSVPEAEIAKRKETIQKKVAVNISPKCHAIGKGSHRIASPKTNCVNATMIRRPLALYPQNVPGSPALVTKSRKKAHSGLGHGTPGRLFAPFVDMDIIVLDDEGRRLSQERRVSKPDVQTNIVGVSERKSSTAKRRLKQKTVLRVILSSPEASDQEEEYIPVHVTSRPKRRPDNVISRSMKHRARQIVLSSSSSSEDEDTTPRQLGILPRSISKTTEKPLLPSTVPEKETDKAITKVEPKDSKICTNNPAPSKQAQATEPKKGSHLFYST